MIYFLRHKETGLIKIGKTRDFYGRLHSIKRQWGDVEVIATTHGYSDEERAMHEQFKHLNNRSVLGGREWFDASDELIAFIQVQTPHNVAPKLPAREARKIYRAQLVKDVDSGQSEGRIENRTKQVIIGIKEKFGYSQKELAQKVGMNEVTLSRFLRMDDANLVSIEVLNALHKNFGLTPNDILLVKELPIQLAQQERPA